MRIGVLGPTGMLGRELQAVLPSLGHEFVALGHNDYTFTVGSVHALLADRGVDGIINCANVLPSKLPSNNSVLMVMVNALLPHLVVQARATLGGDLPLVQVSTDRVFSGRGMMRYAIDSAVDARDYYGKSKALGEVVGPGVKVVRTSYMGETNGFMRWLLASAGGPEPTIQGWVNSLWSGGTVDQVAKALPIILFGAETGIHHLVTKETVSKYSLAQLVVTEYALPLNVVKAYQPMINHSLMPTIELTKVEDSLHGYRTSRGDPSCGTANGSPLGVRQDNIGEPVV